MEEKVCGIYNSRLISRSSAISFSCAQMVHLPVDRAFEVFAVLIDSIGPPPGLCEQLCKMFIFLGLALDLLSSVGDFYTQVVVKTRPEYLTLSDVFIFV